MAPAGGSEPPSSKERRFAMASETPPRREPELVPWLLNLNTLVQANGVAYGLPAAVSADLNTKYLAFKAKWDVCQVPTTRTTPAIGEKDLAKLELLVVVR